MKSEYSVSTLDHLRRVATEQAEEIKRLRAELSAARFARFDAEMQLAIARNDEQAWAKAMTEREAA